MHIGTWPCVQRNSLPLEREITLISLRTFRVPSGFWTFGPGVQNGLIIITALLYVDRGRFAWLGDWFCP